LEAKKAAKAIKEVIAPALSAEKKEKRKEKKEEQVTFQPTPPGQRKGVWHSVSSRASS
jgi:valyl-tRNA synthetase